MTDPWWWWPAGAAPGQRPVLFFPPAGADQTVARPLVPLAGGLRLGVLRLPGRGPRQDEAGPEDLMELAAAISASVLDLDGPPALLVGHSFGGLLAYATACRIEDAGGRVARLLAVASASPPSWRRDALATAFVGARTDRIIAEGGVAAHIAADAELAGHARRLIATDVGLMHREFPIRPLGCPVTVIRGRGDRMVDDAAVEGWSAVSSDPVEVFLVPGDHFYYRSTPERLVTHLRMELSDLDSAYGVH